MRPRSEEMLSYLTGLGPVGTGVEPKYEWLFADLGYKTRAAPYHVINELIKLGHIVRNFSGSKSPGVFTVLRRLEKVSSPEPEPATEDAQTPATIVNRAAYKPSKEDIAARLSEIPRYDRRSLTGMIFGDPLPERSALARH